MDLIKELFALMQNEFWVGFIFVFYIAAFTGSFLNMLIYRLPLMIEMESVELIKNYAKVPGKDVEEIYKKNKGINLFGPRSKCNNCGALIKWFQNIPLLSYLFLKGKCSSCGNKIGIRYFLVEVMTTIMFLFLYQKFGLSVEFLFISVLFAVLFAASIIDINHKILPMSLTLISLYVVYMLNIYGNLPTKIDISDSIVGSVVVYLIIFSFINIYEKIRGIEQMMGRGDFGLFAIGGALYGVSIETINYIFIASCFFGILSFLLVTICAKITNEKKGFDFSTFQMPFGPSISIAIFTPLICPEFISFFTIL